MNLLWAIKRRDADVDKDNGIDVLRDGKIITASMLFFLFISIVFFCATVYVVIR